MDGFNVENADPGECLALLDEVIFEIDFRDDVEAVSLLREHLGRIAEVSGSTAVAEVAGRGDKREMLDCLRSAITQAIVTQAYGL